MLKICLGYRSVLNFILLYKILKFVKDIYEFTGNLKNPSSRFWNLLNIIWKLTKIVFPWKFVFFVKKKIGMLFVHKKWYIISAIYDIFGFISNLLKFYGLMIFCLSNSFQTIQQLISIDKPRIKNYFINQFNIKNGKVCVRDIFDINPLHNNSWIHRIDHNICYGKLQ